MSKKYRQDAMGGCEISKRWFCTVVVVVAAAFIVIPSLLNAAAFDPGKKYRTIKTPHFSIHYASGLESVAQRSAKIVENVYGTLTPRHRWKPLGRTQLILTDNFDQANGSASVLPYNWLLIRVTAPDADSALSTHDDWLRTLIMHEYTHILHMDQARGFMKVPRLLFGKLVSPNGILPGWMREGVATYEETKETTGGRGRSSFAEMMLRTSALQGKWPKIDQADGTGWRWPGSNSQYIYGEKFLAWLADKYGDDKVLEYQRHVAASPFFLMVNYQAKRTWKKSFYKLWREWRDEMGAKYVADRAELEKKGLTNLEPVSSVEPSLSSPALSADGSRLAYAAAGYDRHPEIRVRSLVSGAEWVVRKKQQATHISFSPDGKWLAYSASGVYKKYNNFDDVYLVDIDTGKLKRITAGKRAFDPDFSPDGKKLVYVVNDAGAQRVVTYDLETRQETEVKIPAGAFAQFSTPRWSPDGKTLVVSAWREGGLKDILLVGQNGSVKEITHDKSLDQSPVWSRDGTTIFFTSDRSGITNVYKYDLGSGKMEQVTNVLTGVFMPAVSADGKSLVVQHYTGNGYDLRKIDLTEGALKTSARGGPEAGPGVGEPAEGRGRGASPLPRLATREGTTPEGGFETSSKKYSPFTGSLFLPRFISPNVVALDNGVLLSGITGGSDPLRRHNWVAGVTYRTDAKYVGYFGTYYYNRFNPLIDLSVNNYAVNFGNLTFLQPDGTTRTVNMYEKRLRGAAGITVPWKQHRFSLQYFMEKRDNIPALTAAERAALNLDRFSGLSFTYRWGNFERFPASISLERGRRLKLNFTVTDKLLGSNEPNEQKIFAGDYRQFVNLPWLHHVLALRVAGGMTWGDRLIQGTFGLGGSLGEGNLAQGESFYYFPLRGLPVASLSRTRAMLMSAEYRIPLASPQRGLGTWPISLNNLHAAIFADYGNAWNAGESTGKWQIGNFFLGTGLELRGDFVLGHGLPVTGRLGYGVIVLNRDRLGNLVDPIFKNSVRNGTAILQLGTSF